MKKIPKTIVNEVKKKTETAAERIGKNFGWGILAGIFFEASFMFLGFEKRVVRGVTANKLG